MIVQRSDRNPILKPNRNQSWEATAVFNPTVVQKDKKVFMLYRALSSEHYHSNSKLKMMISDIGIAQSRDGVNFTDRSRFIIPEEDWEIFGCEDPRATFLNGKYYVFYTALSQYPFVPDGIKIALAISRDLKTIDEKQLITPFNAKGMTLFPNLIGGKIWALLTVHTDRPPAKICVVSFENESDLWNQDYWQKWHLDFMTHSLPLERYPQDQVEVGATPLLTKHGWLVIYSYIRNYFTANKLFTTEAILLNRDNPKEILARTEMPIMTPEEYYEKTGMVQDIVFPTGAYIEKDWINLYYGAADTTCCLAKIELSSLLDIMLQSQKRTLKVTRLGEPIIEPTKNTWENKATFNPAAIYLDEKFHLVYRAMGEDNTSVMAYATSRDGVSIDYRAEKPIYKPSEKFESKSAEGRMSGCEDPRLTLIEDKIYMCYTAYDGENLPRVALSSIKKDDFLNQNWQWEKPVLISPPDFDDKDAFVFPEKIDGKYLIVHRSGVDIDFSLRDNLDFDGESWLEENRWISPRRGWWDGKKVGAAAPPVKTNAGWVLLYHGVSDSFKYRVGALLLDLKNPLKVLGRTDNPLMEPETPYELKGMVSNVVFPCGNVLLKDTLYIYYGGADKVVGVATCNINELVKVLKLCKV